MQGGRFRPPLGVCGIAGFAGRCKHRPLRTRGKALPGSAGYLWHKAPGGRERPPYNARETGGRTGGAAGRRMPPSARNACVGADACIGPPTGLAGAASSALSPVPGRNAGRAFSPAAWGLRHRRVCGTMRALPPAGGVSERNRYEVPALSAEIVPYGCGAGSCRGLQDTREAKRQCTPPSAPCGASTVRFAVPASHGAR